MFNRKKNAKPYFKDYVNNPNGFKEYVVETLTYLQNNNVEAAIDINVDDVKRLLPDNSNAKTIWTDESIDPEGRALLRKLMQNVGFELFGEMLADSGFTKDEIEILTSAAARKVASNGKSIPGFNEVNVQNELIKKGEFLYNKILEVMGSILQDALTENNIEPLHNIVEKMDKMIRLEGENADEGVLGAMTELRDITKVFIELIDDEKTTVEEYEAFFNKLIQYFIEEEVDDTNAQACKEHASHDADECEFLKKTKGNNPLEIIYRRIHSMDGTNGNKTDAIPSLSIVVLDTVRAQIIPIAFSLHDAMTDKTGNEFISACKTEEGSTFLVNSLREFAKANPERFMEMMGDKFEDDDKYLQAAITVAPEVITPKAETIRRLLDETRHHFNEDAEQVFADINPEDFLK